MDFDFDPAAAPDLINDSANISLTGGRPGSSTGAATGRFNTQVDRYRKDNVAYTTDRHSINRALAEPNTVSCTHLRQIEALDSSHYATMGSWLHNDEWVGPYAMRIMRCHSTHANIQTQKYVYCERCFDALGTHKALAVHECYSCNQFLPLSALREHSNNPTTEQMLDGTGFQASGPSKMCVFCLATKNKASGAALELETAGHRRIQGSKIRLPPKGMNTTPAAPFRSPQDVPTVVGSANVEAVRWDKFGQSTYNIEAERHFVRDRGLEIQDRNFVDPPQWDAFNPFQG